MNSRIEAVVEGIRYTVSELKNNRTKDSDIVMERILNNIEKFEMLSPDLMTVKEREDILRGLWNDYLEVQQRPPKRGHHDGRQDAMYYVTEEYNDELFYGDRI